jgi:hypothetical protein
MPLHGSGVRRRTLLSRHQPGQGSGEVFHKPEDYASFCQLLQEAADRVRAGSGLLPDAESFSRKIALGCPARQGGEEKGLLPEAAPIL